MDDWEIIDLYFERNESAIRETEAKYGNLCMSIARNILGNEADTEECVNDTYLSVWNTIPPQRPNNFVAFISKITRNISLKRVRFDNAIKRSALTVATVYKGNIIKNLIMDCQSYTKYRPNETTGGIFVSWRRKEELPTGA